MLRTSPSPRHELSKEVLRALIPAPSEEKVEVVLICYTSSAYFNFLLTRQYYIPCHHIVFGILTKQLLSGIHYRCCKLLVGRNSKEFNPISVRQNPKALFNLVFTNSPDSGCFALLMHRVKAESSTSHRRPERSSATIMLKAKTPRLGEIHRRLLLTGPKRTWV